MDNLNSLLMGFQLALTPTNLAFCFLGCILGTIVGVLPGLGPGATMAMLIPLTAGLEVTTALIMLAGIYYGGAYGGSTTSILINVPGEAGSVATCIDGHEMAKQGRAGPALGISAVGSFVAGTISVIGLMLVAPPMAALALSFGPPEYFFLMLLGMTVVMSVTGESMTKGLLAGLLGIFLAMIGTDTQTGAARFTYGNWDFASGFDIISCVVGLFGIAEVLSSVGEPRGEILKTTLKGLYPSLRDLRDCGWTFVRGSLIGFFIGILPGGNTAIGAFMAYDIEKKLSPHPERFGKGAIRGVAAPESANNSVCAASMIPMLTLGLPVSAAMAIMMGAVMMHGLRPGPMLFTQNADFVWALIASMYIGNVVLLVLNLPLIGIWVQALRIPYPVLAPIILIFCFIGAYSIRNSIFDVWIAVAFGVLGAVMRRLGYPVAPMILGLVLAPMMEAAFRQSLSMSRNSLVIFVNRPGAVALLLLCMISIAAAAAMRRRQSRAIMAEVTAASQQ